MLEKIIFTIIAFILFLYILLFKMIKRNDTTYLVILAIQAIGILISFLQIICAILLNPFCYALIYLFSIIAPFAVFIIEKCKINISELITIEICKYHLYKSNLEKTKENLFQLIDKYNDTYLGHIMLAEVYEKENNKQNAIDEYVRALDIKQDDYKSYYRISVLLIDSNKKEEAIAMLQNLLKNKPDYYEASKILGDILLNKQEFKKAIEVYTKAVKYHSEIPEIYYNLGLAYSRINDFPIAKKCFEKTTELKDNFYNAYYRLGQISLLYRDFDSAKEYFEKSSYESKEAKSYYEIAKIYMMKNEKNKAILLLNKLMELDTSYYQKIQEEPVLFGIKKSIEKPTKEIKNNFQETEQETQIENYLNDTFNLTKHLK